MKLDFSNETLIRNYLLGTLSDENLDEMNEKLLSDGDFVQLVELVEDEIIEDYLDGTLTRADREAVETYFLRAPERQDKMAFARLLSRQVKGGKASAGLAVLPPIPQPARFDWRISGAIAALLFLAVTTPLGIYTAKLQSELKTSMAKSSEAQTALQAKLDQARSANAELSRRVEALQSQIDTGQNGTTDSLVAVVTPLPLVRSTGPGQAKLPAPDHKLTAATKFLKVRIILLDAISKTYHVDLLDADNKIVWSKGEVSPVKSGHSNTLQFFIDSPSKLLPPGEYRVAVTGNASAHAKDYEFAVAR